MVCEIQAYRSCIFENIIYPCTWVFADSVGGPKVHNIIYHTSVMHFNIKEGIYSLGFVTIDSHNQYVSVLNETKP